MDVVLATSVGQTDVPRVTVPYPQVNDNSLTKTWQKLTVLTLDYTLTAV